jgi:hypothetical protein
MSDADVVSVAAWGPWSATSDDKSVFFDLATTRGSSGFLLSSLSDDQRTGVGSAEIIAKEVRSTATGVAVGDLEIEFLVAPVAPMAVAIKVTLALFVELGSGIPSRHGGSRVRGAWEREVGRKSEQARGAEKLRVRGRIAMEERMGRRGERRDEEEESKGRGLVVRGGLA